MSISVVAEETDRLKQYVCLRLSVSPFLFLLIHTHTHTHTHTHKFWATGVSLLAHFTAPVASCK